MRRVIFLRRVGKVVFELTPAAKATERIVNYYVQRLLTNVWVLQQTLVDKIGENLCVPSLITNDAG